MYIFILLLYIYIEREREIRYRETQGESLCYKPENTLTLFRYFFVFSVSWENKEEYVYVCNVCYANLFVYHFWFSSFPPTDSSTIWCHFLTSTLLCSYSLALCCYKYVTTTSYMLNSIIIHVLFYRITIKSVRKKEKTWLYSLLFITLIITFTDTLLFFDIDSD